MEEIKLTWSQLFQYAAIIHAAIGFLLGLIPFIAGVIKKKVGLGALGLIIGTVGGALLGFLGSIPSMAIFTWLIVRDRVVPTDEPTNEGKRDEETPAN